MKKNKMLQKIVEHAVLASVINGKINPSKVRSFVSEFKKLPQSKAIFCLKEYKMGLKRVQKSQTLTIESTIPLSKIQIGKIGTVFKKTHTISTVKTVLNPSLLGGLRITIGDSVFDDSIENKIDQLKEVMYA